MRRQVLLIHFKRNISRSRSLGCSTYEYIPQYLGIGCSIGDNVVLCKRCILKDYSRIEAGTVVPSDMTVPPFAIVEGRPGRIVGEVSESITTLASIEAVARYKSLKPISKAKVAG